MSNTSLYPPSMVNLLAQSKFNSIKKKELICTNTKPTEGCILVCLKFSPTPVGLLLVENTSLKILFRILTFYSII